MSFVDSVQADIAALTASGSELGQAVTYTPASGDASTVRALVTPEDAEQMDYETGERDVSRCEVILSTADVSAPARGETFTIDGTVWNVDRVDVSGHGVIICELWRPRRTRTSGPGGRPSLV